MANNDFSIKNSTRHAKRRAKYQTGHSLTQKIVLFVIAIVFIIVLIFAIIGIFFSDRFSAETRIKSEVETLAHNYYQGFIQPNIVGSQKTPDELEETLGKFQESGFQPVFLRQLLHSEYGPDAKTIDFVLKHCDENSTYVKYYPEPPYSSTSYHFDITYSCDF